MQAYIEAIFDIFYLSTVITLGLIMIKKSNDKQYILFGIMAIVLGVGDSFHLIPRVYALFTTGLEANIYYLGIGKLITSITMTIFYVILYYVYVIRYKVENNKKLTNIIYILALVRIVLCLLPQNMWTLTDPSLAFGIYRNIPFTIIGILIIVLFYKASRQFNDKNFKNMWLSIVLSFGFYIPVVLLSNIYPIIGVLMIPKTIAYVWTVLIGYKAMKNNN